MLAVPLKRSPAVRLSSALQSYIKKRYGSRDSRAQQPTCDAAQKLRDDVIAIESCNEGARMACLRYLAQIDFLSSKFPVGRSDMRITFAWSDTFSTARPRALQSWDYERANVLFNLAAVESGIGAACNLTTKEGLRAANKRFSAAAGILHFLGESVVPQLLGRLPNDLSLTSLSMYEQLMLAQAQACFFMMAESAGMPKPKLAQLAIQAADLFRAAERTVADNELRNAAAASGVEWSAQLKFQSACFDATAYDREGSHRGVKADEDAGEGMGEAIAFLDTAFRAASAAEVTARANNSRVRNPSAAIPVDTLMTLKGGIAERLAAHREDNDAVYFKVVPAFNDLPKIEAKLMAKVVPWSPAAAAEQADQKADLFGDLTPPAVSEAVEKAIAKLKESNKAVRERAREASTAAREQLQAAGLPASVDAGDSAAGLPAATWERVQAVQIQGGAQEIASRIAANKRFADQAKAMMDEVNVTLRADASADESQRAQWGQRWQPRPHLELAKPMWDTLNRLAAMHQQAGQSDATLAARFEAARPRLDRLALTQEQLAASVPASSDPAAAAAGATERDALKAGLVELERLQAERDEHCDNLDSAVPKGEVVTAILAAHAGNGGSLPADAVDQGVAAAQASMAEARQEVEGRIQAQAPLLERIMLLDSRFKEVRGAGPSAARAAALQTIQEAVDEFQELLSHTKEGSGFYNTVLEQVRQLQNRAAGFKFAREVERNEAALALSGRGGGDGTPGGAAGGGGSAPVPASAVPGARMQPPPAAGMAVPPPGSAVPPPSGREYPM